MMVYREKGIIILWQVPLRSGAKGNHSFRLRKGLSLGKARRGFYERPWRKKGGVR